MRRSPIIAFIVASSLPLTLWPLAGLAIAAHRSNSTFDFSIAAILVPFLFGTFHAISVAINLPSSRKAYFLVGAGLGLLMASIGTFLAHVPETVYGLTGARRYLALLGGPLFYSAVWGLVLWPVEQHVQKYMRTSMMGVPES